MTTLAHGKWLSDFESLTASLQRFDEKHRLEAFGEYSFSFVITDDPTLSDPARRRWMIGSVSCDKKLYTITTEGKPHPDFEGWPFGELEALRVPQGLQVWISHEDAYKNAIRAYLEQLLEALIQQGLEIVEAEELALPLAQDALGIARSEVRLFKSLVERQLYKDVFVNDKPQENIARALLQAFLPGRSYREVPVGGGQSDLLLFAKEGRFLYETKIWRGPTYYGQGLREIDEYIAGEGDDQQLMGIFYIVFDSTSTKRATAHLRDGSSVVTIHGHDVDVVVVNLGLPEPSTRC